MNLKTAGCTFVSISRGVGFLKTRMWQMYEKRCRTPRYYAAYGSNLNLVQMARRCPTAKVVGKGVLEGWRLRFRGRPGRGVATIERAKNRRVPVLIFVVQPEDERSLDRYEGWPKLYRKENVQVKMAGTSLTAFAYIMNEWRHPYEPPNSTYFGTVLGGYCMNDFNVRLLMSALINNLVSE